tara:strand:+ start:3555 stop:3806 length:252 start_codon:yes stop_codon:yes gene_type:complete
MSNDYMQEIGAIIKRITYLGGSITLKSKPQCMTCGNKPNPHGMNESKVPYHLARTLCFCGSKDENISAQLELTTKSLFPIIYE